MNKTSMNLQDNFLNQARKENIPVTIYLISGVQLKGIVRGFDAFTVVLETPGKAPQLVYKHAVASIVPMRSIGPAPPREDKSAEPPKEEKSAEPAPATEVAQEKPVEPAEE